MERPRIGFLPAFFTVLAVIFGVAVAVRIHRYSSAEDPAAPRRAVSSSAVASDSTARTPADAQSEDGSVVPADARGEGTASTGTMVSRERERQQRYNQLLHQPLPPSATHTTAGNAGAATSKAQAAANQQASKQQPAQKQSLLSRIVSPIVNAFSSTPSKAPETSSNSQQKQTQQKDPNSDTTPPQLLSVEFVPPSIKDGEATVLAVHATDDLSGIASIAGNVISPSGALQGFAMVREGDTPRYTARIAIPKSAAEGLWHLNYLSLTDKASNTASYSYSQGTIPGTPDFRVVSSDADNTPPTLRALWLDRLSMKGGEKNTLFVQADDDKSGVNLISGVFLSPAHNARVGFGCRFTENANAWSCDFAPPVTADCGDWQLEQIQLQDKANNMAAIRHDNPLLAAVHLNVLSDQCDSTPPAVSQIVLDRYSTPAPGTVVVRISATDDISGVSSVSGHFVYTGQVSGSQPPKLWFACSSTDPQTWSGPVAVPDKAAVGVWRLEQVQILDKANNLKIYTTADPIVANVSFRVQ